MDLSGIQRAYRADPGNQELLQRLATAYERHGLRSLEALEIIAKADPQDRRKLAAFTEAFDVHGAIDGSALKDWCAGRLKGRWDAVEDIVELGIVAVEPLIQLIEDDESAHRPAAMLTLGRLGKRAVAAAPAIAWYLRDDSLYSRFAGQALAEIGPAALAAIKPFCKHSHWRVRMRVVKFLGTMGEAAIPMIIPFLLDSHSMICIQAFNQLSLLGAEEEVPLEILQSIVANRDVAVWRKLPELLKGYGELGIPLLLELLEEGDALTQERVAETFCELGVGSEELLEALREAKRRAEPGPLRDSLSLAVKAVLMEMG